MDKPFILLAHLLSDFAKAIKGSRQKKIISRGKMSVNMRETAALTIESSILALGSR
jgi:hypothetical protein